MSTFQGRGPLGLKPKVIRQYLAGLTGSTGTFSLNIATDITAMKLREFTFPQQTFPELFLYIVAPQSALFNPGAMPRYYINSTLNTDEAYINWPRYDNAEIIQYNAPVHAGPGIPFNYYVTDAYGNAVGLTGSQVMGMAIEFYLAQETGDQTGAPLYYTDRGGY